jgi:hypothetical protein
MEYRVSPYPQDVVGVHCAIAIGGDQKLLSQWNTSGPTRGPISANHDQVGTLAAKCSRGRAQDQRSIRPNVRPQEDGDAPIGQRKYDTNAWSFGLGQRDNAIPTALDGLPGALQCAQPTRPRLNSIGISDCDDPTADLLMVIVEPDWKIELLEAASETRRKKPGERPQSGGPSALRFHAPFSGLFIEVHYWLRDPARSKAVAAEGVEMFEQASSVTESSINLNSLTSQPLAAAFTRIPERAP